MPKASNAKAPAVSLSDPAADTAEAGADAQACHVDAGGERTRRAAMIVRNQRQRCGQIRRLAHSHQGADGDQLPKLCAPAVSQVRNDHASRLDDDQPGSAEPVREESREGTEQAVDPQEHRGQKAELSICHRDRGGQGIPHRGDHDAVEIVQHRDDPQHADNEPARAAFPAPGSPHFLPVKFQPDDVRAAPGDALVGDDVADRSGRSAFRQ